MSFFSSSITFVVGMFLIKLIPFTILPIVLKHISSSSYGILATVVALQIGLKNLFNFSTHSLINVEFFKQDKRSFSKLVTSSIIFVSFTSSIFTILLMIITSNYPSLLGISVKWILIISFNTYILSIWEIMLSIIKAQKKSILYIKYEITRVAIDSLLTLFFVVKLLPSWKGKVIASTITAIIILIISLLSLYKYMDITHIIPMKYFKPIFYFGLPLLPHTLASWTITLSDRLTINSLVSFKESAGYSLALQIASIISFIALGINYAWQPFLYENLNKKQYKKIHIIYLFIGVVLIIFSYILYIAKYYIIHLITHKSIYINSMHYLKILLPATIIASLQMYLMSIIFFYKKTYLLTIPTILSIIINIIGNIYFISISGVIGAAYTTLLSHIFYFITTLLITYFIFNNNSKYNTTITKP